MVPPGIPGRSDADFLPAHDPDGARALLAEAGYPGGRGFPETTLLGGRAPTTRRSPPRSSASSASTVERRGPGRRLLRPARRRSAPDLLDGLGRRLSRARTTSSASSSATGSSNNYGRWSSPTFDQAIADALATHDPAAARAAFDRAEAIVRDEAPAIPLTYDVEWSLARTGLLGA